MNTKVAIVLLVVLSLLAFGAGWRLRPDPEPVMVLERLPPEIVEVQVVKEIEVPGPERVVERVKWRTREIEVPIEILTEVERLVVADRPLSASVSIDAEKYEGADPDGKLVQGWAGTATCQVSEVDGPPVVLVREPFDLSASVAESVVPPAAHMPEWWHRPRRTEFRLGLTTAPGAEVGFTRYGQKRLGWWASASIDRSPAVGADDAQLAGGLAWSFGRR